MPARPYFTDSDEATFGAPPRRHGLQALAGVYALLGGSLAGALLFNTGLSFWALLLGLAVMIALVLLSTLRSKTPRAVALMIVYSFAFALLSWPVLLLAASVLWGSWQ